jgi:hypothetical protein
MAETITEKLLALGWRFNGEGVLVQPPGLKSVPLYRFRDPIGDRYFIEPPKGGVIYIRGADGQIVDSYWRSEL